MRHTKTDRGADDWSAEEWALYDSKRSRLYRVQEDLLEITSKLRDSSDFEAAIEQLNEAVDNAVTEAEEVRDEYQEALDFNAWEHGNEQIEGYLDAAESFLCKLEGVQQQYVDGEDDKDDQQIHFENNLDEVEAAAECLEI